MTLQDLLRSPDPANVKLAAVIATPEQFHEAVLGEMEWLGISPANIGVMYSNDNHIFILYGSIGERVFLVCRYYSQPIFSQIFDMKKTANYLQTLDNHLRKFTSTIQKRLCEISL